MDSREIKTEHDDDFKKAEGKIPVWRQRSKWKNDHFFSSLEFAITGLVTAFKEEPNMKRHVLAGLVVLALGLFFKVSAIEWLFLLLAIALVIAFEIINSAIENVVDLASDYHFSMLAKTAKDMSAGAVLFVSGFAVAVGLIVFLPKLWQLVWA